METFIFTVIARKPLVKLQSNENTYNTKSKHLSVITVPHGELISHHLLGLERVFGVLETKHSIVLGRDGPATSNICTVGLF